MSTVIEKLSARQIIARAITEKDFQAWIVELARHLGWNTFHAYEMRRCEPGWPDLVLVKGRRLIFAELKSQTGKATIQQEWWLNALRSVAEANMTIEVHLWRPENSSEIEEALAA